MLLQGKPASDLREAVDAAVKGLTTLQVKMLEKCVPDDPEADNSEPDPACVAELEPLLKKAARTVTQEVSKMNKERQGWIVEFASAMTTDFPDDAAGQQDNQRIGAWFTASYNGNPRSLTFVGVGRYFREATSDETVIRSDLGARLIWKADPNAMPPLALSIEYVRRFTSGGDDEDKLVAVLEYPLPFDNISIIASYGKVFGEDFFGNEELVATFGINFGFGRGPVVAIPEGS